MGKIVQALQAGYALSFIYHVVYTSTKTALKPENVMPKKLCFSSAWEKEALGSSTDTSFPFGTQLPEITGPSMKHTLWLDFLFSSQAATKQEEILGKIKLYKNEKHDIL